MDGSSLALWLQVRSFPNLLMIRLKTMNEVTSNKVLNIFCGQKKVPLKKQWKQYLIACLAGTVHLGSISTDSCYEKVIYKVQLFLFCFLFTIVEMQR
jgi:formylmethanofuran dehydrogenase subunit E-like metal-binding protein